MAVNDLPRRRSLAIFGTSLLAASTAWVAPANAWEPTRNVEFIVPAGTGGAPDSGPMVARPSQLRPPAPVARTATRSSLPAQT